MTGPELSILAFSDGYTIRCLPGAQDHKRIGDGDQGPNTGGMGAYAPAPVATAEVLAEIQTQLEQTIAGMRKDGFPFVGLLFTGFMLTPNGVKVLEYNVRFGDPETEALMLLLDGKTDLAEIMLACVERRLDSVTLAYREGYAVSVVLASGGYPAKYATGLPITIGQMPADVVAFHAGTTAKDGQVVTAGGRVLAVAAFGSTLRAAVDSAYAGVKQITFEGMTFRTDIAYRCGLDTSCRQVGLLSLKYSCVSPFSQGLRRCRQSDLGWRPNLRLCRCRRRRRQRARRGHQAGGQGNAPSGRRRRHWRLWRRF